jgi:hypothetical protein
MNNSKKSSPEPKNEQVSVNAVVIRQRFKWMDICECPQCGEGIYNHRDKDGNIDEAQCSNPKCDWKYPNDVN